MYPITDNHTKEHDRIRYSLSISSSLQISTWHLPEGGEKDSVELVGDRLELVLIFSIYIAFYKDYRGFVTETVAGVVEQVPDNRHQGFELLYIVRVFKNTNHTCG